MKSSFSRTLCTVLAALLVFTLPGGVHAAGTSIAPKAADITITNNTGTYDIILIGGLARGDKVNVYSASSGGKLLGSASVSSYKTEATVKVSQLGTAAGSVYISVTSKGELESSRTKADYPAEVQTDPPDASNIAVTNNAGKADLIYITGLYGGEKVNVYNATTGGKLLGSASVSSTKSDVTVKISQIGVEAGSVYVSLTNKGELESIRTKSDYSAEPKSAAVNPANITVINNAGINDTVSVVYLSLGDTVNVYDAAKGGNLLASAKVPASKTEVSMNIPQLSKAAGYVYVTVTSKDCRESDRTEVAYPAENTSNAPYAGNITITNNGNAADTVKVTKLLSGDVVKVYDAASGGNLLGSATVSGSASETTVTIPQLISPDGYVYISVTTKGKFESARTKKSFSDEPVSDAPKTSKIVIVNNVGKSDTVNVSGLSSGDVVKIYDSYEEGTLLGSAAVGSSKSDATVTVKQLGADGGYIYISVTEKSKLESERTKVYFSAEPVSNTVDGYNITVINNPAGKSDTVQVTGLAAGDIVKVYDLASDGTLLGSATVASSKTEATVTIAQLGTGAGYVYVSITSSGKNESSRIKVNYSAEASSDATDADNIIITNNVAGTPDTVEVTGLKGGDVIKVYDAANGGSLLGYTTVPADSSYATVSIAQLGVEAGNVYVSITGLNKLESSRVKASYAAEGKSQAVDAQNITITNNSEAPDTVEVTGLNADDTVKVYTASKGGTLLGSATVSTYGTYARVSIPQLGTAAGSVYVSITSKNKQESDRTKADYAAEAKSASPSAASIYIENNVGADDKVTVTELSDNDTVKVYDSAKGGSLLGSASAGTYETSVSISISQLGSTSGSIYVSITSSGKLESDRTKADYAAESKSASPDPDDIIVINNAGTSDTVQVTGLNTDDKVKVYDSATGGTLLGSATVSVGTGISISITQLGTSAGSVYVSVTSKTKTESDRVKADYSAEAKTPAPSVNNIEIINNVGTADTVKVAGLTSGDKISVYDSAKAGSLLGTASADTYASSVTISITQLGPTAGSVYVSVTSSTKLESDRTKADYSAEAKSAAPSLDKTVIANNSGMADTIKVSGLTGGDTVKVYDSEKVGNLLGSAEVETYASSATITVTQLGSTEGSVYVSVTEKNKTESDRTKVIYSAEPQSAAPSAGNITVLNNAGIDDTIKVSGISGGDEVKVYTAAAGGMLLGSASASTYDTYATVTVEQLGGSAGSVYVSLTKKGYRESTRVKADYSAEPKSGASHSSTIIVSNNAGAPDIIQINGLTGGDKVNVYDSPSGGSLLGSATVATYDSFVKVTVTQLGASAGKIYVSVTTKGKLESDRTMVSFAAEQKSDSPSLGNITIKNNAGISDTVEVTYLEEGDVVKVYSSASEGTLMGTGKVADGKTEVTVKVTQLGASAGNAYVSVTSVNKLESDRTAVYYSAEATTDAPAAENIKIINNATISDTVTVTFLKPGDVIRIYNKSSGGSLLGMGTVAEDSTEVTVSVDSLDSSGGSVYVSAISVGKAESSRTKAVYTKEQQTAAPSSSNITVKNNAGMSDTVTVTFLDAKDTVKVYNSSPGGSLLGSAAASADSTEVTIKISQLGTSAGNIYVSVTGYGKLESERTAVYYSAEPVSDVPDAANITILNNAGKSDTIKVAGLMEYDVVSIYSSSTGGTLLGTGTVGENNDEVTIKVAQLGTSAGYVYITVTSLGAFESSRLKVGYSAEN
ncbi:hypothetical protein DFR58_101276 [Anaerobacterium chartisolvens]|uniref:Uncharacterized protein n=1 Tax=Anaerobacterium chartisolvens TaxID=1297424 RepID=A0A369BKG0_9FIRM|nr:hypothetical protein [Anaerobacterium chartisolvens]RCX21066.1 hypothetical protein DFR58_101276 [Anaerobacterium chartisolvens]